MAQLCLCDGVEIVRGIVVYKVMMYKSLERQCLSFDNVEIVSYVYVKIQKFRGTTNNAVEIDKDTLL